MLLELPPDMPLDNPAPFFIHDYFNSFTRTMFIGHETRLFVYEALFFCSIDMELNNVCYSALITYVVSRAIHWVRHSLGESNLSRKTLVDRHFLV